MSTPGFFSFSVDPSEQNQRLDVVVASRLADFSRSFAASLIRNHCIRVNQSAVKPGHRLKAGDVVDGDIPPPEPVENAPENIPLDFLYEDEDLAVINKRAGGLGLISGRKAFQRPLADGVALLNAIQDVYLEPGVTIA